MKFDIWSEGYRAAGEAGPSAFEGSFEAESFTKAVELLLESRPEIKAYYTYGSLTGYHKIWGCRLFNNEADARAACG